MEGGLSSLYSLCLAGLSGTGKTTCTRHLACSLALVGARFAVADPHGESGEESLAATLAPLASQFVCQPAIEDKAILDMVRFVADVGERRVKGEDLERWPLVLWVDEVTSLLQKESIARDLGALIEEIARQYRKVGIFCSARGQNWSAARTGGNSALREIFASILCHRLRRTSARMLVPAGDAALVERLDTGQALLWRTNGEATVITVPNCEARDVHAVGQMLAPGYQQATSRLPPRLPNDPGAWIVAESGSQSGSQPWKPRNQRRGAPGSGFVLSAAPRPGSSRAKPARYH